MFADIIYAHALLRVGFSRPGKRRVAKKRD